MSCHDIGLGMNSVVRTVMTLLDEGRITKDAAKVLVNSCRNGVNWCDGNEGEAIDYITGCICGRCFNKIPKGEKLYYVYDTSFSLSDTDKLFDYTLNGRLCKECFDLVINEFCNDEKAGERERNYIEEHQKEEEYLSTGEYPDHNNKYRWPRD